MTARKKKTASKPRSTAKAEAESEVSFENALERLETLVTRLEEGEVPLEESLEAYAEGTRLVRHCLARLDRAETLIRELSEDGEGFRLEESRLAGEAGARDDDAEDDEEDEDEQDQDELPF